MVKDRMAQPKTMTSIAGERGRIADQIFHDLREQIISGSHPRGSKLATERELAERYGASAPTVREAIRGLSVLGLVDVKHGSGAYVSADGESLVAMSLSTVMRLEGAGVSDTLELLAILNEYAAARAVEQASPVDLRRLRDATETLANVQSVEQAVAGVRAFHRALVQAAHHRLLEVICGFLADVQIEFAREVADGQLENWRNILGGLKEIRTQFVHAMERRDGKGARKLAREFHTAAVRNIMGLPKAREVRFTDPQLGNMLSTIVNELARRS